MSIDMIDVNSLKIQQPLSLGENPVLFRDGGRLSSLNNSAETDFDAHAKTVEYLLWRLEHTDTNLLPDKEYLAMLGGAVLQLNEIKKFEPAADSVFKLAVNGLVEHSSTRDNLATMLRDGSVRGRLIPAMAAASEYYADKNNTDEQLELLVEVQRALDALDNQYTAPMPSLT